MMKHELNEGQFSKSDYIILDWNRKVGLRERAKVKVSWKKTRQRDGLDGL